MLEQLHDIPEREVLLRIATLLRDAGGRALLVGGCVRDLLQGIPSKDLDVEVYGMDLDKVRQCLAREYQFSLVGLSFGILKIHGHDVDIALPRTENKVGAGHRGFVVQTDPRLSFREACSRRDFTLNAIMLDPLTGEIIDPLGGERDLRNGVLRHCGAHFAEDPLRVLRAMQFVARFGYSVAPETVALCATLSQGELPPERLAGEWEKLLLKGKCPSRGLAFLRECGWVRFYPELAALIGCGQNPKWHPEGDVWNHTLHCLDAAVPLRNGDHDSDLAMTLGVLCHDFGKPLVSAVNENGDITSINHAAVGEAPTLAFLRRMWNQPKLEETVCALVHWHMEPYSYVKQQAGDSSYRRLSLKVNLELLYKVARCDSLGRPPYPADLATLDQFMEHARALAVLDSKPRPILLGRHLLARGFSPGPRLGGILQRAFDAQLNGEFATLEEALLWLDRQ
ncbi:MAG: hypothetical protein IJJ33_17075 [Victivallales bacterium]|nr:hypothetical protein [Victivallales bacterium]